MNFFYSYVCSVFFQCLSAYNQCVLKEEKWRANLQQGGWKKLHFRLFIMIWLWAVYQYFYVTKEVQEVM